LDRLNPPERVMAFRLAPLQALPLLPPVKFQDVCIIIVPNGIDSRLPGGRHSETRLPWGSIRKWIAGEQEEQSLILLCRQADRLVDCVHHGSAGFAAPDHQRVWCGTDGSEMCAVSCAI
jgi:hypothetical protein